MRQPRKPMRMAYDPLLEWVMDALRKGWTPERIEGRLKVEWPDDPHMRISHECLHQWIHAKPQRALDLRRYLPRGKRHRCFASIFLKQFLHYFSAVGAGAVLLDSSLIPSPPIMPQDRARVDGP